jgi:microsomal prostaglandin-E synthase 2
MSSTTTLKPRIVLYRYAICPFCHTVQSLLDYGRVDYETVEVNPLTKAEIRRWKGQHSKVPIATLTTAATTAVEAGNQTNEEPVAVFGSGPILKALLDDAFIQQQLQARWAGSTMTLDQFAAAAAAATPITTTSSSTLSPWQQYAHQDLAVLLYPNMCRTWSDSYRAFAYVHGISSFGPLQRFGIQTLGSLVRNRVLRCL